MGVLDYSLRHRVAALEQEIGGGGGGGGGGASPTVAGSTRVTDAQFTLPDPTKAYYVTYQWDSPSASAAQYVLWYGDPDGNGWFNSHSAADMYDDETAAAHKVVLKGQIPAGKTVMIQALQGANGVTAAAIETPLS